MIGLGSYENHEASRTIWQKPYYLNLAPLKSQVTEVQKSSSFLQYASIKIELFVSLTVVCPAAAPYIPEHTLWMDFP